jgi:hypothetical protein
MPFSSTNAFGLSLYRLLLSLALKKVISAVEGSLKPASNVITLVSADQSGYGAASETSSPLPKSFEIAKTQFFFKIERELEKVGDWDMGKSRRTGD